MSDRVAEFARYVEEAVQHALGEVDLSPDPPKPVADSAAGHHELERAHRYANLEWSIPPGARFQLARKILRIRSRLIKFVTAPQTEFNLSILRYLKGGEGSPHPAIEASLGTISDQLADEVAGLKARVQRAEGLLERLGRLQGEIPDRPGLSDEFYADHQERFRGSPELVKERLGVHMEVVRGLTLGPTFPVVDLGCGRGEWLELLAGEGFPAYGVDDNGVFVESCRRRNLLVEHVDAREHLAGLPEGSAGAVTAFHLVEHFSFDDLAEIVDSCFRALRPGGALIFETPNPNNVNVAISGFYLDPTHRAPLPPLLLEFLLSRAGFIEVDIRYLDPTPRYSGPIAGAGTDEENLMDDLNRVFFGAQDYAVVAYRPGTP